MRRGVGGVGGRRNGKSIVGRRACGFCGVE